MLAAIAVYPKNPRGYKTSKKDAKGFCRSRGVTRIAGDR